MVAAVVADFDAHAPRPPHSRALAGIALTVHLVSVSGALPRARRFGDAASRRTHPRVALQRFVRGRVRLAFCCWA
jgi:hypothetical protein